MWLRSCSGKQIVAARSTAGIPAVSASGLAGHCAAVGASASTASKLGTQLAPVQCRRQALARRQCARVTPAHDSSSAIASVAGVLQSVAHFPGVHLDCTAVHTEAGLQLVRRKGAADKPNQYAHVLTMPLRLCISATHPQCWPWCRCALPTPEPSALRTCVQAARLPPPRCQRFATCVRSFA